MLILTRNINKTVNMEIENTGICIDVTVLSVRGKQVDLGFKAPLNVKINREEVTERIAKGQQLSPQQQSKKSLNRIKNG